jgi:hypothetical protein
MKDQTTGASWIFFALLTSFLPRAGITSVASREGRGGTGRAPSCLHDRRVRHRQAVGMKLMMVVPAQSVCTSLHVRMRMCVCAYLAPSAAFAHSSCTLPYWRVVV